jgi:dUTP pyrophosphatase
MRVYREREEAQLPEYATEGSACFDLRACLAVGDQIRMRNPHNKEMLLPVKLLNGKPAVQAHPGFRILVPTGLIFDIPSGYYMDITIRSSMAFKYGLVLANAVGIVDADYVEQTYMMILNTGDTPVTLYHGDRIAQAKIVKVNQVAMTERKTRPSKKGDRDGGIGSTGTE